MYPSLESVNTFTYVVMGLSFVGGLLARRYGSVVYTFSFSFVAAPFFAFLQKEESDFNHFSKISKYLSVELGVILSSCCSITP